MSKLIGYRKFTIGALGLGLGFLAAMMGKLTPELAGLIGTITSGFFAANGYTTGRGRETVAATASQQ